MPWRQVVDHDSRAGIRPVKRDGLLANRFVPRQQPSPVLCLFIACRGVNLTSAVESWDGVQFQ